MSYKSKSSTNSDKDKSCGVQQVGPLSNFVASFLTWYVLSVMDGMLEYSLQFPRGLLVLAVPETVFKL